MHVVAKKNVFLPLLLLHFDRIWVWDGTKSDKMSNCIVTSLHIKRSNHFTSLLLVKKVAEERCRLQNFKNSQSNLNLSITSYLRIFNYSNKGKQKSIKIHRYLQDLITTFNSLMSGNILRASKYRAKNFNVRFSEKKLLIW